MQVKWRQLENLVIGEKMPEPLTRLQSALVANAVKKHADKKGFYLFVNINDGTHAVRNTALEAFEEYRLWYEIVTEPPDRWYFREMMGILLPLT